MLTLTMSCTKGSTPEEKHIPQASDTLYTEQRAMDIYGHEPEQALLIIDSAEIVGNLSDYHADLLRAKVYGRSMEMLRPDTVQTICKALLGHDSITANTDLQIEVIDQLINVCRLQQDYEQWMHWATEKAAICHERAKSKPTGPEHDKDETEALRTEAEIGVIQARLGQRDEGLERLDRIIAILDRPGSVSRFDALIIALKRKINVLEGQTPYAVIPVAQLMLDRLDHIEAHPTDYAEDSDRLLPDAKERASYLDFYRAQAHMFLAEAYIQVSKAMPRENGENHVVARQMARDQLTLYDKSDFSRTYNGRRQIAPVRVALGEYDQALASFDEQEQRMGGDTVTGDYAVILRGRAEIAEHQGRLAASLDYRRRYEAITDTLHTRLMESKASDYAAHYQLQEQRIEAEQQKARADRSRLINLGIGILLFIIVAAQIWRMRHNRIIRHKNRSLAEQISENIKYKKMYAEPAAEPDADLSVSPDTLSHDELFERIHRVILHEKLYLNPNFDRQALIDHVHLSARQVGRAFAQGSDYTSITQFINDCRLEHACQLLTASDTSIDNVATASGFSVRRTFSRLFKEKYGLTPTEYRNQQQHAKK